MEFAVSWINNSRYLPTRLSKMFQISADHVAEGYLKDLWSITYEGGVMRMSQAA